MIGRLPTEKELIIYREKVRPTTEKITGLLLRSGAFGFWEFQRSLYRQSIPADANNPCRINPEDLKAVFRQSGVLLIPDEQKSIVLAYSDSVGFVVTEPFFDAICPVMQLPVEDGEAIARLLPVEPADNGQSKVQLPNVTLDSVLGLCMALFSPLEEGEAGGSGAALNNLNAALQVCYEEAAVAFTAENYPQNKVPALEVLNFVASELLLNEHLPALRSTLLLRLHEAPLLERAPDPVIRKTKQGKPIINTSGFSMVHEGLRWNRLFERYMNEDRRDEWLRGRDERNAGNQYLKHTCGYAGHLPEFKRHFGRTFHIIEEDLPLLTKSKKARTLEREQKERELNGAAAEAEPANLKRFGPGMELPKNRNEHHYILA